MIYLYGYLVVGVLVFVVVLGSHLISTRNEVKSELANSMEDVLHPERKTLRYRFLEKLVVPVLASGAVVVGWPVAIWMKIKDMRESKSLGDYDPFAEPKEFEVRIEDLQQRLNRDAIEDKERIVDPLGAVPSKPFGHLNSVWQDFLDKSLEGCEYWSFKATWKTQWGEEEIREGYASVNGGEVKAFFISFIHNEAEAEASHSKNN